MIIIDNYFNNIDLVRACGLDAEYYPPNENEHFGGYRSPRITEDTNIGKMLNDKIVKTLEDGTGKSVSDIKIYFHCSPHFVMNNIDNFHEIKYHRDESDYAGIVYITPNPPQNTGTCIEGEGCIENVYNRFIAYESNLKHGPDNLFGFELFTSRMTVTFFAELSSA